MIGIDSFRMGEGAAAVRLSSALCDMEISENYSILLIRYCEPPLRSNLFLFVI